MSSALQLIGLGVDDMYIVLLALKKEKDFTEKGFLRGMQEVVVPVSMTSFVNASMFAVMNSKFWFPIFFLFCPPSTIILISFLALSSF